MAPKVRTSRDVFVDEDVNFNLKKAVNIVPGQQNGEAVEYSQLNGVSNKLDDLLFDIDIGDTVALFENSLL